MKSRDRSPPLFFLLVFALSIPFWLVGVLTGAELLPHLPVSALMFVCPLAAALILVRRENGSAGVVDLLKRSLDCKRTRTRAWYAPVILLMPGALLLTYGLMHVMGLSLPAPHIPWLALSWLLPASFAAALCEELGWSGYATDPMQKRWNALQTGLLIGSVWAAWHLIPLLQAHRPPSWIAGWCLLTVASRVLIVWLYNNTGRSVFAAALYHAISNVSWLLFPNNGSHYEPRVAGPIVALVAAIITVVWGPATLTRRRTS